MSGRVVHFEIPADDLDRVQAFYREAFGWQTNAIPEMDYVIAITTPSGADGTPTGPGAINGGMLRRQDVVTQPAVTIDVADVDEALRRLEQLGGKTIAGRQAVGDMGFSAYFEDPEGNVVGLWETAPQA